MIRIVDERRITVLAGGVGAARFLQGVVDVVPPQDVTAIGNVGDDLEIYGLHVSPDLDTVLYTLTRWIDEAKGWGVRGDSDRALERARSLGAPAWFWLGDLDIGLHLARTERLRQGEPLSAVTAGLAAALGLAIELVPSTDDRLRTMVATPTGELDFQTYYVGRQHSDTVTGLRYDGAEAARPAPGVIDALSECRGDRDRAVQSADLDRADPRGARHPRGAARSHRALRRGQPDRRRRRAARAGGRHAALAGPRASRRPAWPRTTAT